ncbi:aldehyde dehydrogenase family protein [Streptomyces sp. ActVer]|uniref:aldehyde dehydrogenase family protein n=1 Tax=Streptomyces sp. ActVer TaxID=3014558 RepID=UPI0022B59800|nr:aldehyde dehydrogenase family protein [Streptomyces sp. ActVer]MCZ4514139.1 aldehyde dehydrogenase family protein [Streptomyces sp. ActVer]
MAADLAEAAFWNAGQNCTAGSRTLAHFSIEDEFVAALVIHGRRRRRATAPGLRRLRRARRHRQRLPAMAVAREETFGPVVTVLSFDTDEEALAIADDTDCAPTATVWSHDIDRALMPARSVVAGTVAVNGPDAERASWLPRPDRESDVEGS